MASPRARPGGSSPGFPRTASRPGSAASSATPSTSATWRAPTPRSTPSRSQRCARRWRRRAAIGAEGVVFHVGSHLGSGLEAAFERIVPALRELLALTDDRPVAAARELRRRRRHDRSLRRTSWPHCTTHSTVIRALACVSTRVTGSCPGWTSRGRPLLDAAVADLDARIGLDRLRCLHVNDAAAPLGSNRDRHASIGAGTMAEGLGTFLAHPAFQDLPALLETPGPDGHGPDADEVRRLRELHARGMARSRRRKARARA